MAKCYLYFSCISYLIIYIKQILTLSQSVEINFSVSVDFFFVMDLSISKSLHNNSFSCYNKRVIFYLLFFIQTILSVLALLMPLKQIVTLSFGRLTNCLYLVVFAFCYLDYSAFKNSTNVTVSFSFTFQKPFTYFLYTALPPDPIALCSVTLRHVCLIIPLGHVFFLIALSLLFTTMSIY